MSDDKVIEVFSKNLIRLLNKKDKNQYELAEYMGVSRQTITNYVKGYNLPRMDKVDKIAEFFGVSRDDLLSDTNKMKSPTERIIEILGEDVISANTGINVNDYSQEQLEQIADRLLDYARFIGADKKMDK
ncbi:helix-turn-helix transcriptional regulator [Helcococcus kunzii]|uniref:helix-turn-helix domain-containing protein n=1 Tax=Helcococcus kunzii TaxID=40091 RepID=UPI001BAEE3B9|nr:helix-turn-helix transcriptional regulator [Helcococcus kunzii]QUY64262.1 helix-turn-helix transcriptional regulator [Helcococcus kunzii]